MVSISSGDFSGNAAFRFSRPIRCSRSMGPMSARRGRRSWRSCSDRSSARCATAPIVSRADRGVAERLGGVAKARLGAKEQAVHRLCEAGCQIGSRVMTSEAFCPPKPNEFDIAAVTRASRAWFGTTSNGIAGIRHIVVDGRRDPLMLERKQREDRLDRAGRRERVADHRFVRRDRDFLGALAEHGGDRRGTPSCRFPASRCRAR